MHALPICPKENPILSDSELETLLGSLGTTIGHSEGKTDTLCVIEYARVTIARKGKGYSTLSVFQFLGILEKEG